MFKVHFSFEEKKSNLSLSILFSGYVNYIPVENILAHYHGKKQILKFVKNLVQLPIKLI